MMNLDFKRIKKILTDDHVGSEGLETVILSPLIFGTFFMLMYFFFMTLTFILYNNIANSIAQELNMRQTGYQTAMDNCPNAPKILTYRNSTDLNSMPPSAYLSPSKIKVSPETQALKSGTYFALDKYKDQFIVPFSEVTGIEVETTKAVDPAKGRSMAGTVITVKIHYTTMSIGRAGHGLIPMTAVGYGIIS